MKIDLHNHTIYSFDSDNQIEQTINEAISKNIDILGFSDHLDFAPGDKSSYFYKPKEQFKEFNELKIKYENKIQLKIGIEASYEEYYYSKIKQIINNYPFDYIIMSVHFVDKIVISKWMKLLEANKNNIDKVDYSHYFEQMLELVKNGDFNILGHIDYYKKYSKFNHKHTFEKYLHYYKSILKILIDRGKVIEINSSGLRYENIKEQFPSENILELYKDLGGKIVSIGSDSHHKDQVAYGFNSIYDIINKFNLKLYTFGG